MDKYITKYLRAVNKAKTNEEKLDILNKIYDDGFTDGFETVVTLTEEYGATNIKARRQKR